MTRENMFTKIVAWLICAVMIIGMIPNVSLPAAAAENDWEGDIDVVETTEPPVGTETNPAVAYIGDNTAPADATDYFWAYTADYTGVLVITEGENATEQNVTAGEVVSINSLNFNLAYKPGSCAECAIALTELENTVTNVGALYYSARHNGATMTITGTDYVVYYGEETLTPDENGVITMDVVVPSFFEPFVFQLEGDGEFQINFAYPEGSYENPAVAFLGYNGCTIEAGDNDGYYYNYTADYTGTLIVEVVNYDGGWSYTINNMTSYSYGETQWSDSDPVVNPAMIEVTEGDLIEIIVNTYDPENEFANPGGSLEVNLSYPEGSVEAYPIYLTELENTVTNAGTLYYASRHNGATMTITGTDYVVYYGEETLTPDENGVLEIDVVSNMWQPFVFQIEGDGDLQIDFEYPLGSYENPHIAHLGDNAASIAEGNTQGYLMSYTAEKAGDLVITISGEENWQYVVNNMTTYIYGDTQWSDSDPVVNPTVITVAEGDVIEITLSGYDPADMWNIPAAEYNVNLAYAPEGPIVDANLKFYTVGLSFAEYIGIQPLLMKSAFSAYDSIYVEAVQISADGTNTTTVLEPIVFASYNVYDMQMLPKLMTDEVVLTIYGEKDGVKYQSEPYSTSIRALAMSKIEEYYGKNDLVTCKILVDLLNYGAEVQLSFTYNTTDLANAELGEYASLGTSVEPTISGTVETSGTGITVYSNSLSLGSKVEIQFMFKATDVEGCELRYTIGEEDTVVIPASEFIPYSTYAVASFALKPRNFRDPITIAVYNSTTGEAVSAVYTASVEAYSAANIAKGNRVDLLIAMMKYGDAVIAKFAS